MTNDQLLAFIAVVEKGSFRSAANAIFKTQSSVSAAVKNLEQEFNLQLLSRETYRPSLTTEGKAFYQQAKKLLVQANELESLGHKLAAGAEPILTISLSAMCAIPPGLNAMKRFCEQNQQVHLSINTEHLSGVLEQLQREKADLAIGPHHGLDDSYEFIEISQITMITVAAPVYIKSISDTITHAELRQLPHILMTDTGTTPFDHFNVIAGGKRWYVSDYLIKKSLLLAGMGWARIPLHMIEKELEQGELVPLKVANFNSTSQLPIYLIRLRDQPQGEIAQSFWDAIIHHER